MLGQAPARGLGSQSNPDLTFHQESFQPPASAAAPAAASQQPSALPHAADTTIVPNASVGSTVHTVVALPVQLVLVPPPSSVSPQQPCALPPLPAAQLLSSGLFGVADGTGSDRDEYDAAVATLRHALDAPCDQVSPSVIRQSWVKIGVAFNGYAKAASDASYASDDVRARSTHSARVSKALTKTRAVALTNDVSCWLQQVIKADAAHHRKPDRHPAPSKDVICAAYGLLETLTALDYDFKKQCARNDSLVAFLTRGLRDPDASPQQIGACMRVLANLCTPSVIFDRDVARDDWDVQAVALKLTRHGVGQALGSVFARVSDNEDVVAGALTVLTRLICVKTHDPEADAQRCRSFMTATVALERGRRGLLELVTRALRLHGDVPEVQTMGVALLCTVTSRDMDATAWQECVAHNRMTEIVLGLERAVIVCERMASKDGPETSEAGPDALVRALSKFMADATFYAGAECCAHDPQRIIAGLVRCETVFATDAYAREMVCRAIGYLARAARKLSGDDAIVQGEAVLRAMVTCKAIGCVASAITYDRVQYDAAHPHVEDNDALGAGCEAMAQILHAAASKSLPQWKMHYDAMVTQVRQQPGLMATLAHIWLDHCHAEGAAPAEEHATSKRAQDVDYLLTTLLRDRKIRFQLLAQADLRPAVRTLRDVTDHTTQRWQHAAALLRYMRIVGDTISDDIVHGWQPPFVWSQRVPLMNVVTWARRTALAGLHHDARPSAGHGASDAGEHLICPISGTAVKPGRGVVSRHDKSNVYDGWSLIKAIYYPDLEEGVAPSCPMTRQPLFVTDLAPE